MYYSLWQFFFIDKFFYWILICGLKYNHLQSQVMFPDCFIRVIDCTIRINNDCECCFIIDFAMLYVKHMWISWLFQKIVLLFWPNSFYHWWFHHNVHIPIITHYQHTPNSDLLISSMCVCVYECVCLCACVRICVCMCVCVCMCMRVCMCVCMWFHYRHMPKLMINITIATDVLKHLVA